MNKQVLKLLGTLACASLVGIASNQSAHAGQRVNTTANACAVTSTSPGWAKTSIPSWVFTQFDSGGISNPDTNAHDVTCPLVRAATGNTQTSIYIDATNTGGSTTSCTVFAYDYTGTLLGSSSFSDTAAAVDHPVTLTIGSTFDYLTYRCTLVAGAKNIVRGSTDVDL